MTIEVDELLRTHRAAQAWRIIDERHPESMLFAIFDAARFPSRLYHDLASAGLPFECLLGGEIQSPLREAAPWCVKLGAEPRAGRELFCRYWGLGAGVFVTAPLDAALTFVRRQLKRLLRVELPSGKTALFRFYDPRILRTFLPTCDRDQLSLVMGSHHGLWLESEAGDHLLQVPADTADGLPVVHGLRDEVGSSVRIQILRTPNDEPVSDVAVEIRQRVGQSHSAAARTDQAGTAMLATQALPVGTYDVHLVFPDGDQYQLFDERNRPLPAQIRLHPSESVLHVLRIKRNWLSVRVMRGDRGICGARVQLRRPTAEQETNSEAMAEFSDLPVQTADLTAHIETLVPDAEEGAWEVVEVSAE